MEPSRNFLICDLDHPLLIVLDLSLSGSHGNDLAEYAFDAVGASFGNASRNGVKLQLPSLYLRSTPSVGGYPCCQSAEATLSHRQSSTLH